MRNFRFRLVPVWLLCALPLLAGCDRPTPAPPSAQPIRALGTAPDSVASDATVPVSATVLRMRIDGVEWTADHNLFGVVHPPGYDRAVLMAGSHGPKDANEQAFNINLYGIEGPGRFRVRSGNTENHVAQISNLSPERYLAGGPMGFYLNVDILRLSACLLYTSDAADE